MVIFNVLSLPEGRVCIDVTGMSRPGAPASRFSASRDPPASGPRETRTQNGFGEFVILLDILELFEISRTVRLLTCRNFESQTQAWWKAGGLQFEMTCYAMAMARPPPQAARSGPDSRPSDVRCPKTLAV